MPSPDQNLAAALTMVWDAFFARHGRLTPIQQQSVMPILEGRNVLLTAATASGKTEAACAPLTQRMLELFGRNWTVLYISPTRALVNDLYKRLAPRVESIGLKIRCKTGDHANRPTEAVNFLLTTPESWDSLLCRGTLAEGHLLASTRAVVLDELHLLHGNPRGEQLRWLMARTERLLAHAERKGWSKAHKLQRVALSATIQDPLVIVNKYLGEGTAVSCPGHRVVIQIPSHGLDVGTAILEYLKCLEEQEKLLVFCNKRARVDDLAGQLEPELRRLGYEVLAHHGSLSKSERLDAEERSKGSRPFVLFATSTLEIGIDIGDIDLVVLDGPAPNVMSLLQRLGRGNRRTGQTRVMLCGSLERDRLLHDAMIKAAIRGELGEDVCGPIYSVATQQAASYVFQSPKRERSGKALLELLEDCLATKDAAKEILDAMCSAGGLVRSEAGFRLGPEWLERSASGSLHSNIEDGGKGTTLIDSATGRTLATGLKAGAQPRDFSIGGRAYKVRKDTGGRLEVKRTESTANSHGGYVTGPYRPLCDHPQVVRRLLCIADEHWPVLRLPQRTLAFHLGGSRVQAVLRLAALSQGFDVNVTPWSLQAANGRSDFRWLQTLSVAALLSALPSHLSQVENWLGRPRANGELPHNLRIREAQEWLDVAQNVERIHNATVIFDPPESVRVVLRLFADQ